MSKKKWKSHKWPVGSVIEKIDWHFCQRLFKRYGSRLVSPGEIDEIKRRIRRGEMTPLIIKFNGYPIYCYKVNPSRPDSEIIYLAATSDGEALVTALRHKWIRAKLHDARVSSGYRYRRAAEAKN